MATILGRNHSNPLIAPNNNALGGSMYRSMSAILLLLIIATHSFAAEGDWIQLFNGKDLDGWTPKIKGYELGNNFGNTFRVEDGVLKVSYDQYEKFDNKFGHLFHRDKFSNYR